MAVGTVGPAERTGQFLARFPVKRSAGSIWPAPAQRHRARVSDVYAGSVLQMIKTDAAIFRGFRAIRRLTHRCKQQSRCSQSQPDQRTRATTHVRYPQIDSGVETLV